MPTWVGKLRTHTALVTLCACLALSAVARAQPVTEPAKPVVEKPVPDKPAVAVEPEPGPGIREAKPETFYLIDKDGKLVPFFDIPFEEFRRLYLLDRKLKAPDQPPRFSLQQMVATGTVEGNQATLDVSFRIQLNETGWTRVPLRMNNAVLAQDEAGKGDASKQFIEFDKATDGYIAWFNGEKGTNQTLKLKLLLPVEQVAGDSRLFLQTPRASGAELHLKVPTANAVVDAIEGIISQPSRKLPDGRTELRLLGLSGEVPLVWREAREQPAKTTPVLEASGVSLFRFEGQSHVSSEARLKVRGLNGPIDSFQVRLPAGLKLIPVSQPRYVTSVVEPKDGPKKPAAGSAAESQLVEVKLASRTSEYVEITLLAEMTRTTTAGNLWETSGFEVLGAIGQWGHVDLAVEGDWSLNWVEGSHVQRVPEPAESPAKQALAARFEYSRQPFSLQVQVLPKRTRISVEPSYVVQVEPQQARLEARLKYKVRGAKAYSIEVDLSGWKIDPNGISPANMVQLDAISFDQTSPLKIPLTPLAQTAGGEFELKLAATRDAKPGEKLSFTLPRPQAGTITPGAVVILPADNVELTPIVGELQGLVQEPLPPVIKLPPRQQSPLFYRDRSENGPAQFAGQYKVRKGAITVSATGRLRIDDRSVQVEQRLLHRIAFEPLKELVVDVPRRLFQAESLKFTLDGEPLAAAAVADEAAEATSSIRQLVRLDLRGERIGPSEIVVIYNLPLPALEAGKELELVVPLVTPTARADTTLTTNSLTVTNTNTIRLERGEGAWTTYEDSDGVPSGDEHKLFAPVDTPDVSFMTTLLQPQKRGTTSVAQAWVQTWLTERDRRDRAAFRLHTSDARVRIQLPAGARTSDLDLAVNGRRIDQPRVGSNGQIEIELPTVPAQREFIVEVWYSFNEGRPARGGFAVEVPRVIGAPWTSRVYWQLVAPQEEHLIVAPQGMTPELDWRWQGLGWGRQASLTQEDLEKWIGATPQPPLPSAVNQYLYSSFGAVELVEVRTAGRATILLVVSGGVLLVGLLLIYIPRLRHPTVLLLAAVVVLGGGLFEPELALQVAQVAALGLALALGSRVLRWMLTRRRESRAILHGSSLIGLDSNVEVRPVRRESEPRVSTATSPLTIPVTAAEARA